jgi:hypothetical protein
VTLTTAELKALIRTAAVAAVNAQAEAAQDATKKLAPKDSGALEESIQVDEATKRHLTATVYSDAPHALYQHEALDIHHPTGQAKFMEAAVMEQRAGIEAAGAAAAAQILG